VRLLDDVLKLAKLRTNDPKKYVTLAVNMLKDRLNQSDRKRQRKRTVRFAHTLETLLMATDNEPELITTMLTKKPEKKKSSITSKYSSASLVNEVDSLERITEEDYEKIDTTPIKPLTDTNIPSHPMTTSVTNKDRQTLPIIDEGIESTAPSIDTVQIGSEFYPEALISSAIISHIGLTVAQLIVLITGQNQEPIKLTNAQIEQ
jgi:hypothetical protein